MSDVLVPLAFFVFLAAVILMPGYFKSRDRARMHETLRIAYEKGQPVPPELIAAIQSGDNSSIASYAPEKDLRRAVVLIGVALGLVAMSFAIGQMNDEHARYGLLAGAAIPGFIGLGFLALWYFGRNKKSV